MNEQQHLQTLLSAVADALGGKLWTHDDPAFTWRIFFPGCVVHVRMYSARSGGNRLGFRIQGRARDCAILSDWNNADDAAKKTVAKIRKAITPPVSPAAVPVVDPVAVPVDQAASLDRQFDIALRRGDFETARLVADAMQNFALADACRDWQAMWQSGNTLARARSAMGDRAAVLDGAIGVEWIGGKMVGIFPSDDAASLMVPTSPVLPADDMLLQWGPEPNPAIDTGWAWKVIPQNCITSLGAVHAAGVDGLPVLVYSEAFDELMDVMYRREQRRCRIIPLWRAGYPDGYRLMVAGRVIRDCADISAVKAVFRSIWQPDLDEPCPWQCPVACARRLTCDGGDSSMVVDAETTAVSTASRLAGLGQTVRWADFHALAMAEIPSRVWWLPVAGTVSEYEFADESVLEVSRPDSEGYVTISVRPSAVLEAPHFTVVGGAS